MFKKMARIIQRDGIVITGKRLLAYAIAHSPFAYHLSFPYAIGTRLVFAPSQLTYNLFANPGSRSGDTKVLQTYVGEGASVIDVGANIGSITVPAAQLVGPTGCVLAFEPSPKFHRIAKQNVARNHLTKWTTVHRVALGPNDDTVHLNEMVADDTTNHIATTGTPVTQRTLDAFTTEIETVDFLKIDVEGYELGVLKGATDTLSKTKIIYIEFVPTHLVRAGTKPEAVLNILEQYFSLYLRQNGTMTPFTYDGAYSDRYPDLIGIAK